jgi:hypothetical protein
MAGRAARSLTSNQVARSGGREDGASSGRPRPGASPPEGGRFPSLLFEVAPAAQDAEQGAEDRSFAPDLNLDQIVTAVAGAREEHDLITTVLYRRLRDANAARRSSATLRILPYSGRSSVSPA